MLNNKFGCLNNAYRNTISLLSHFNSLKKFQSVHVHDMGRLVHFSNARRGDFNTSVESLLFSLSHIHSSSLFCTNIQIYFFLESTALLIKLFCLHRSTFQTATASLQLCFCFSCTSSILLDKEKTEERSFRALSQYFAPLTLTVSELVNLSASFFSSPFATK